jgi:hypothetical protein
MITRRSLLAGGAALAASARLHAQAGARVYSIVDYGAKGDGKTLDTRALQSAIDACTASRGGVVLVPAGMFVIGTVELKSNVTLRIAAGGKLVGSADGKQYHAAEAIPLHGDSTLEDGNVGLLFAVDGENITVEGPGTIDGQGLQFRSPSKGVPPPSGRGGADRPYHLLFHRCRNLRVRDLTLVDCAFHSIRVIQSKYVWMDGLHIHNRVNSNNDGFHFISAENVHVTRCDVETQDDACAMFGSCRFVTVSDSTFSTRWSVFRFGGGNPENVTISNCVIYQTYGCPIKLHFGPESKVQNLQFSNIVMHDVTGPIAIHRNNRARRSAPADTPKEPGFIRNIGFRGIRANVVSTARQYDDMAFPQSYRPGETRQCIVINALEGLTLEEITFDDVHVRYGGGGTLEEARREMPQVAGEYFEIGTPCAYGVYARNVRGLRMHNVVFQVETPDVRPALVLDHVSDAGLHALSIQGNKDAASTIRVIDGKDILIEGPRLIGSGGAFLDAEGAATHGVILEGGDLSQAASPVAFASGAAKDAVKVKL